MTNYPSVDRLAQLQQLIADFAKIERVPMFADINRHETDVDHSFGLTITCWYLQPKIAPELNIGLILEIALAHDIVELHAGDTYVFDTEGAKDKDTRERQAISQLRDDWHDFPELSDRAEQYMNKSTEEAKFVKAVDKLLPLLIIELGDSKTFWNQHGITLEMERENKVSLHVSPYMSPYYEMALEWLDSRGNIATH